MIFRGVETTEMRQLVRSKRITVTATLQEDQAQGRIDVRQLVLMRVGPLKGAKPGSRNPPHPQARIRQLHHDIKELAERSPDENDRGRDTGGSNDTRVSIAETRRRPESGSRLRREYLNPMSAAERGEVAEQSAAIVRPGRAVRRSAGSGTPRVKEPRRMTRGRTTNRLMQSGVAGQPTS